jgi:hypothetical protein
VSKTRTPSCCGQRPGTPPLLLQAKLLRGVDERVFEPLGCDRPQPLQVRLVAASNAPLERAVAAGRFRRDLYFRLSVVGPLKGTAKHVGLWAQVATGMELDCQAGRLLDDEELLRRDKQLQGLGGPPEGRPRKAE